ncbi:MULTISPECIES: KTSC domain-containing protein [Phenylobacterium]|uniref:Lysyl-tRNA synthetase class 2 n=1 Tax=Phenylobacterium koreense TaxID=266125 RepID=A0ABV2EK92_9CAUL
MQVDSEAIRDVSYDAERAKLFVTFIDGDRYVYVGVPGEVHRSFLEADSKGQFFAYEIRDQYPYNKVDAEPG